ncbi:MAG: hypothetical protein KY475_20885 [Planctomycetes bacterium]|nr:hypothetical protein [Planctomycetota bacterium]
MMRNLLTAALVLLSAPVLAQAPGDEDARGQRLAEMRRRAEALVVRRGDGRQVERSANPRLRFGDPTRAFHDGTLWTWSSGGRPVLMVGVERYEDFWSYELISLTPSPLEVQTETGWRWKPQDEPAVERPVPGAPAPAESAVVRGRQMRELARRFTAVEYIGPARERIQLRLQPRPILEYENAAGVLDGTLFVLSNGTNPELLLMLEAAQPTGDAAEWRYGVARISTAELELSLDGAEVWSAPHLATPRTQTSYTYFSTTADRAAQDE